MVLRNVPMIMLAILMALFPTPIIRPLARMAGHRIAPGARIGFSLVLCHTFWLAPGARIGHLNLIANNRLLMREQAQIGNLNLIRGPFHVALKTRAAIGNRNVVTRARRGISYGPARLQVGPLSKITAGHKIDCTKSVLIGGYSTIAGAGTQIWTHGYIHTDRAPERYRVDGGVRLGNNVNVGSRSIITGGVTIGDNIMVGVGTTVSKSLREPGMYVSAGLRQLPLPPAPESRTDMEKIAAVDLVEAVYLKHADRA